MQDQTVMNRGSIAALMFELKLLAMGGLCLFALIFAIFDIHNLPLSSLYNDHAIWMVIFLFASYILGHLLEIVALFLFHQQLHRPELFWSLPQDLQQQIIQGLEKDYQSDLRLSPLLPKYRQSDRKQIHVINYCLPAINTVWPLVNRLMYQTKYAYTLSLLLFILLTIYIVLSLHPFGMFSNFSFYNHSVVVIALLGLAILSIYKANRAKREAEHAVYIHYLYKVSSRRI